MGRTAAQTCGQVFIFTVAIFVSLAAVAQVSAAPADPSRVAAVFPPWWSAARTVSAAASAGDIAGIGGAPFVVILHGDPQRLTDRARSAGALLILGANPGSFCSTPFQAARP
jgi:hypothetical protein